MEIARRRGGAETQEDREEAQKVGDLEIHQDLSFESQNWRVQRLGWAAMGLFVAAGLAGAFGRGALASSAVTSPGGLLRVVYERFTRHGSPAELRVTVSPSAIENGTATLLVSRRFLHDAQIDDIQPEPASVTASGEMAVYTFHAAPGEPAYFLFRFTPDGYFRRVAELSLSGGREPVRFVQIVFP